VTVVAASVVKSLTRTRSAQRLEVKMMAT
jgi:hypothetical protein